MQAASVESLLGVSVADPASRLRLAHSIQDGLPVSALDRLAKAVAPEDSGFKFRLVPKATLERRRRSADKKLTSDEGDRLARIAKVFSFAASIYKDDARAREFLTRPHAMLDGEAPLDVTMATGPGADEVMNLLGRMAFGAAV